MTSLRNLAIAASVFAGLAAAGTARAAPANAGNIVPARAAGEGEAATPAHHWQRRCWPVYRWVWTHWGWRYRYVGTRCARPHADWSGPHRHPYWR